MDYTPDAMHQGANFESLMPPAGARGLPDDIAKNAISRRDTTLLRLAVLATQDRTDDLREQVVLALAYGITPQEIVDILDQAARHAGHSYEHQLTILGEALHDAELAKGAVSCHKPRSTQIQGPKMIAGRTYVRGGEFRLNVFAPSVRETIQLAGDWILIRHEWDGLSPWRFHMSAMTDRCGS